MGPGQLDLLYEDRLSERITPEKYDDLSKVLIQEQKDIEVNIGKVGEISRNRLLWGIDVLEKSQQAAKIYNHKSPEEKRKLIGELFTVLHLDGPHLYVQYTPYAEAISKRVKKHREVEKNFRTDKKAHNNGGESELTTVLRTVWRARPDSASLAQRLVASPLSTQNL